MKKIYLLIALLMGFVNVNSQQLIEPNLQGQDLINAIRTGYSPTGTMGYNTARDTMYAVIDNNGDNTVSGIYTGFTVTWNTNVDPSVSVFQNGSGINAEHIYPQSKGAGSEPARSDLHNLRPSKVSVNADRGSCPFADSPDQNTNFWYRLSTVQSSIPSADIDDWSEKRNSPCVFEPRESVKGDIARSVFYFYTIYQNTANSADPFFFDAMKSYLLDWHYQDPVDTAEANRSTMVSFYQGNENPFVLDSTLARRAFFPTTSTVPLEQKQEYYIYPNPFTDQLSIKGGADEAVIFDRLGRVVFSTSLKQHANVDLTFLEGDFFIILLKKDGKAVHRQLIQKG